MEFEAVLDRLAASESAREARASLRDVANAPGLSGAYFERLLKLYAVDAAATLRLARWWKTLLRLGDDPALAYRAKGAADRLRGRWLASAEAFEEAGRLADGDILKASYPAGAIEGYARAGQVDRALKLGIRLSENLLLLEEPALAGRVELNVGTACLWAERNEEARRWFGKALSHLKPEQIVERASTHLGLSTSHLYGGEPAVSRREAEAALSLAEEHELTHLGALCRLNLAHLELISGRPDVSLRTLLEVRETVKESPVDLARAEESLGDVYLRLNLYEEADDAYRRTLAAKSVLPSIDVADAYLGVGRAEAAMGRAGAERWMMLAEDRYRKLGIPLWQSAAILSRAELKLPGNPRLGLRIAERARKMATSSQSALLTAQSCLVCAEAALGMDQRRLAEERARQADRLTRRHGLGYCNWRIHWVRARLASRPLFHFRRMFGAILADRLLQRSSVTRMSFMQDKESALRAYLRCLLSSAQPTRVQEALAVLTACRSATLLDEILQHSATDDPFRRELLYRLRDDLSPGSLWDGSGGARFSVLPEIPVASRRRLLESLATSRSLLSEIVPPASGECAVFVDSHEGYRVIVAEKVREVGLTSRELGEGLNWLSFSLLEPMVTRDAAPDTSLRLLKQLGQKVLSPLAGSDCISPDGLLWQVPWDACSMALEQPSTHTLCLHPGLAGPPRGDRNPRRVAIWVHREASLNHVELEVQAIRAHFPNAVVLEGLDSIRGSMSEEWDLLHVVGHARHNARNPMFSFLTTADGPLYAAEIGAAKIRCGMVCLSACETASLSSRHAFEPDGLIRAFLSCGSTYLVGSLWPLDDEAAGVFFDRFYGALSDKQVDEAVLEGRTAVRNRWAHPYFWGPFCLYRGYQT